MKPPAEWYREQDLSKHYMRRTDRPFEEGVSRGQLRRIAKCESAGISFGTANVHEAYSIIADNRMRKGRFYGMRLHSCALLQSTGYGYCFKVHREGYFPDAAAFCVKASDSAVYVSGWADSEGTEGYSPVCLLARGIYQWCQQNCFTTLDIGIGGDPGLDAFKERLGFRLGNAQ